MRASMIGSRPEVDLGLAHVPRYHLPSEARIPTPWSRWLASSRPDSIRELLLERAADVAISIGKKLRDLFEEHCSGRRDNYDRIWRLLNLELWHRVCLEGNSHDMVGLKPSSVLTPL
jgi:hypothetical protein